jgi:hypothetical protein
MFDQTRGREISMERSLAEAGDAVDGFGRAHGQKTLFWFPETNSG